MNETDSVTHVQLYDKDFFGDEVNLLISNVVINIDFIVSDLQDYLSLFAAVIKNLI